MVASFPANYALDPRQFVQGPTKVWYAPYVPNGADPAQGNIVALGSTDKSGVEFDHKPTYADVEVDQSTTPVDTFMTKQEWDLKFNLLEFSAANVKLVLGQAAASLVTGGGITTQNLGEPFDVLSSSSNPSMRPNFFSVMFQFPSPGHDNQSTPVGAWAYYQFFKAYVQTHGGFKHAKDTLSMMNVTLRCLADYTVAGPYKIGKIITM